MEVPALAKLTFCPTLPDFHVTPPSFETSTRMLVPVGVEPKMPSTLMLLMAREMEVVWPTMSCEVCVVERTS